MRAILLFIALGALLPVSLATAAPLEIPPVDQVYPFVPTWPGLTVLHVGDSHVSAGLKSGMKRHLEEAGARYKSICWVGSRARSWVVSGRMRRELKRIRPDVVVITLGTNALRHRNPRRYSEWVARLVRLIGDRTCYWMGPPPLIDDERGFGEMLLDKSRPCRYFDSRVLDTPKRADGKFHLTRGQGGAWADRVWSWMNDRPFRVAKEVAGAL